jgi:hypothetical protein
MTFTVSDKEDSVRYCVIITLKVKPKRKRIKVKTTICKTSHRNLKIELELRCSERICSSCSTCNDNFYFDVGTVMSSSKVKVFILLS